MALNKIHESLSQLLSFTEWHDYNHCTGWSCLFICKGSVYEIIADSVMELHTNMYVCTYVVNYILFFYLFTDFYGPFTMLTLLMCFLGGTDV